MPSEIVSSHHWDRVARLLPLESHNGEVITGGLATADREDLFIPPTIIFNPKQGSGLRDDEIFGPVLPVIEVTWRKYSQSKPTYVQNPNFLKHTNRK